MTLYFYCPVMAVEPQSLLEVVYGVDWETEPAYLALPELDDQGRIGGTDYMDQFDATDFEGGDARVKRGRDKYGRNFLAVLVEQGSVAPGQVNVADWSDPEVLCFFERYTGRPTFWMQGGKGYAEGFPTGDGIEACVKQQIAAMIHDQTVCPYPADEVDDGTWIGDAFERAMARRVRLAAM